MEAGEGRLIDLSQEERKALLVGVYKTAEEKPVCIDLLEELKSLCVTYGLEPVESLPCSLKKCHAAILLGKGKVEEIAQWVKELNIDVVIFDEELSPQQQRNLEKALQVVTIDRTELILGVFAQRAHSKEAHLQVELATLRYQLPRLRRMWTHLSRQRSGGGGGSGGGYVRGEGEKQIEIDRRIIRRRLDHLEKQLEEVKKTREVQRRARKKSSIVTFSIVGYTNAGKSTLMHALTQADVLIEDKLFATLDTTTRKFLLPNRQEVLLIDTVGFIRKIPHTLVAAFRSTLEEALQADVLLHLIDVSHPSAESQSEAALSVIKELRADHLPIISVLNKIDRAKDPWIAQMMRIKYPKTVPISAKTGEGFDRLQEMMMQEIANLRKTLKLRIPQKDFALVSEILREGKVLEQEYEGNDILLEVDVPSSLASKLLPFKEEI